MLIRSHLSILSSSLICTYLGSITAYIRARLTWNILDIFFHADPISHRFQPGHFCPLEMKVCVSMYWRLSQGVESLFQPLVWNHFSDPWGWKHFSVPGTETVSKWFHPRDGKAASLFYSKSSNIHPPLTGITQGVKLVDELGCHSFRKIFPSSNPNSAKVAEPGFEPGTFCVTIGALADWATLRHD